jgi:3-deoxy-D-manno-octulosonate 8-phosphate phosphatase (KDO 8-P phosphatase)
MRFRKVGRRRGRHRLDDAAGLGEFSEVSVISVGHRSIGHRRFKIDKRFILNSLLPFLLEASLAGFMNISPALRKRAAQIKVLLMDVDGTMTDGGVTLLSQTDGTALEIKTFDAHDGQGLTLARTAGLRTGCITGRESAALLRRANEMKMEFIYMNQPLKMPAYEEILRKAAVTDSAVAYIGDDLPDIPLLRRVGLAIAVGDAVPEVRKAAHYTTKAVAGHGAVREAVELILKSKGIWAEMLDKARA